MCGDSLGEDHVYISGTNHLLITVRSDAMFRSGGISGIVKVVEGMEILSYPNGNAN